MCVGGELKLQKQEVNSLAAILPFLGCVTLATEVPL